MGYIVLIIWIVVGTSCTEAVLKYRHDARMVSIKENACSTFCSGMRVQESMGVCLCDDPSGKEAQLGYHKLLNGKCND